MLNEEKIKLMTKCAIYEKEIGHEDLERTSYCGSDYVRLNIWKTVIGVTVSVIICAIIYFIVTTEDMINNVMNFDFKTIFSKLLVIYIVIAIIYIAITIIVYSYRYKKSKDRVKKYAQVLDLIDDISDESSAVKEDK